MRSRCNIIVTGGVNAGKTTLLRALAGEIPPGERVATLESEYELYLHELATHPDVIAFEAREANSEGAGGISLHDLIAHALRHNPRRILVGEVRRGEIMPMLEAMNSGQEGSMCTMHANSPTEAFDRILILGLRGGLALAERAIHILVGMAVDLIVHVRRGYDGTRTVRYVSEILEVMPPGDTERPAVNRLFLPDPRTGRAVAAHTPSAAPARQARRRRLRPRHARPAPVAAVRLCAAQIAGEVVLVIALAGVAGGLVIAGLAVLLLEVTRPASGGRHSATEEREARSAVPHATADRGRHRGRDPGLDPVAGGHGRGRAGRAVPARDHLQPGGEAAGGRAGGPGAVDPPAVRHAHREPRPGRGAGNIGAPGARRDRAGRRCAWPEADSAHWYRGSAARIRRRYR